MDVLSISPIFQQCLADIPKGDTPDFNNGQGRVVVFVVEIVGSEDQCERCRYWMNRQVFNTFIAEDQRPDMILSGYDSVEFCSFIDGDMAGLRAEDYYKGGKWNDAYELAETACDLPLPIMWPSSPLNHLQDLERIEWLGWPSKKKLFELPKEDTS